MVKSIKGVTFSTQISPQIGNRMIYAARGVFNHFIPDVHIFSDHRSGPSGGRSPGYGVSLVAETTTGCLISADIAINHPKPEEMDTMENPDNKPEMLLPEDGLLFNCFQGFRDFLNVKFVIEHDPTTNTVILKCVGCGMKNLSRKVA